MPPILIPFTPAATMKPPALTVKKLLTVVCEALLVLVVTGVVETSVLKSVVNVVKAGVLDQPTALVICRSPVVP